jgi:DNA-binding NtrC family response regulator
MYQETPTQIVIIDDDPETKTRSLYEELVDKYGEENIAWKQDSSSGINFIDENLGKRIIVILDYDFGSQDINGLKVFEKLQEKSSLLYVILYTAKSVDEIPNADIKAFINNHLMAFIDKPHNGYEKALIEVEKAINNLNNRVDCILEEWILRHEFFTREKPYIKDEKGEVISLNDVLMQIRQNTEFGRKMSNNIINTAITLIQKDIAKL